MKLAYVDFETEKIGMRPEQYPPRPVGVAMEYDGYRVYAAWGHPEENNCTQEEAADVLRTLFADYCCVFHNSIFDIEVAMHWMGCPFPSAFHDTLYLAFLNDPREPAMSLKPLAEKYLDMPPDEQDQLRDWILGNIPAAKRSNWGEYICEAPGRLVGRYAVGDIIRTKKLFKFLHPKITHVRMNAAYQRELDLTRTTMRMEQTGIPVAHRRLARDLKTWEARHEKLDKQVRRRLRVGPDVNIRSGAQLADAMEHAGVVDQWVLTPKGKRSVSADNLKIACTDQRLVAQLSEIAVLNTYINTYGKKWLAQAKAHDGLMFAAFNQCRHTGQDGYQAHGGTRTGRFSSGGIHGLQLQNPPNDNNIGLPNLRDYIVAPYLHILLARDYNQQELRILAHYEQGALFKAYEEDPRMDAHEYVRQLIHLLVGIEYPRKYIKIQNFGIVYGRGVKSIAAALDESLEVAKELMQAHRTAFPGIRELMDELTEIGEEGGYIRTWGGRIYYPESPKLIKGRIMNFLYKLLNILIQGSAADATKQAMIQVSAALGDDMPLIIQVHDELIGYAEKKHAPDVMATFREVMEDLDFDVPLLSDGKAGMTWTRMKEVDW